MIYDNIPLIGLEGHVKVEVIDDLTKKVVQKIEGKNGITQFGAYYMKKLAGLMVVGGFTGQQQLFRAAADYQAIANNPDFGLVNSVWLTDNNAAFNSANDHVMKNNITGWATKAPYTGTDTLRGSVNQNECWSDATKSIMVFDFGTDKANGTHRSVALSKKRESPISYADAYYLVDTDFVIPMPNTSYSLFAKDGFLYAHVSNGSTIDKYNLTTKALVETITLPRSVPINQIDIWDGKFYYFTSGTSGPLYEYNPATGIETEHISYCARNSAGGHAIVDGYLYYTFNTHRIYRADLTAKTLAYNTVLGISSNQRMIRLNNQLYHMKADNTVGDIATYDYATNTLGEYTLAEVWSKGAVGFSNPADIDNQDIFFTGQGFKYEYGNISTYSYFISRVKAGREGRGDVVARRVFDTPVVKNNQQTMKVTYTLNFV